MIKLIKNELLKIFKRKSIYLLFSLSFISIFIFNLFNPDQNSETVSNEVAEINTFSYRTSEEQNNKKNEELNFYNLCHNYEQNSWQRYALNKENVTYNLGGYTLDYDHDIPKLINIINNFGIDSNITSSDYNKAKIQYNEYIDALNKDDWKQFTNLKIKNLNELKNSKSLTEDVISFIDITINTYQLRLDNNIEYKNNMLNDYLDSYMQNQYFLNYSQKNPMNNESINNQMINQYKAIIKLSEYAIENKIEQDISPESFNIVLDNKIDARGYFIRTFENFDIIIAIISIFVSCIIITEEFSKGTIKNLLIKPHSRKSIILSKIFACVIVTIISMLFVILSQYIIGGLIFGFESYNLDFIGYDYTNDTIFTMSLFNYIFLVALSKLPMFIIVILFCVLMGIFNKNISMTIILTIIIFLLSNSILIEISKSPGLSIITKFFITNNWDFSNYLFGNTLWIDGLNIIFSIIVYIIYFSILLGIIIRGFRNKDFLNID